MIVLCYNMQGKRILMAIVMFLHFSVQEEDVLEHTNAKCHLCKL